VALAKQRETSRQNAETCTVTIGEFGPAGGLQHVIDIVPADRNRLAERAVQRLPSDSQPRPRRPGQAAIPGHQIEMVNRGLTARVARKSPATSTWPWVATVTSASRKGNKRPLGVQQHVKQQVAP
jgi:hypothetical protein